EVDEVRRHEAQPAQPLELIRREAQLAQRVDLRGDFIDVPGQVHPRGPAAEAVDRVRTRVLVQHRLHHGELVQVRVEQGFNDRHRVPYRARSAAKGKRAQIIAYTSR